jgi:hypothetical protein
VPCVVDQGAAHPRKAQTRCPVSAGTLSGLARSGVRFRPEPVSAFSRIMHLGRHAVPSAPGPGGLGLATFAVPAGSVSWAG